MGVSKAASQLGRWGVFGKSSAASRSLSLYRQEQMLQKGIGYNVSPEEWFEEYPSIGRSGTYVTDYRAVAEALGPVKANAKYDIGFFSKPGTMSYYKTAKLEKSLGLEPGSLRNGFRFTRVNAIQGMHPRSPLVGNRLFMGAGAGLPGGGPELVIDAIPTNPWPQGR